MAEVRGLDLGGRVGESSRYPPADRHTDTTRINIEDLEGLDRNKSVTKALQMSEKRHREKSEVRGQRSEVRGRKFGTDLLLN